MATPNIRNDAGRSGKKLSPEQVFARGAHKEILDTLGLDMKALGPNAKKASIAAYRELVQTQDASDTNLERLQGTISGAHQLDVAANYDAGKAPHYTKVHGWQNSTRIQEQSGQAKLTGTAAGADHPVAQALANLGIDKNNLTPNVRDVLEHAISRDTNLALKGEWQTFNRELLLAKAKDGGAIDKVAAIETSPSSQITPTGELESSTVRDPNLAATAPEQINTGNENGAMKALMRNLSANDRQDKSVAETTKELAQLLAKDAGFEDATPADIRALEKALTGVLKDRSAPDASVIRPSAVALNAFEELAQMEQGQGKVGVHTMAAELARATHEGVKMETELKPETENALANFATKALTELAAAKLGGGIDLSPAATQRVNAAIAGLGNLSEVAQPADESKHFDRAEAEKEIKAMVDEMNAAETGEADASKTDSAKSKTKTKAAAEDATQVDEEIPDQTELQSQVEAWKKKPISEQAKADALRTAQSLGVEPSHPHAGPIIEALQHVFNEGSQPEDVALNTARYLDAHLGTNFADHTQAMMRVSSPDAIHAMAQKGLQNVATFASNPDAYKAQIERRQASGGMGNGMGGTGMPGVPGGFGTGGILGLGNPRDADGAKANVYMQRSIVVTSILNDPSLSIEDKIFYFMMWFAAFADKEREEKMKEIADLDRVNQMNDRKKQEITHERQQLMELKENAQKGADRTNSDLEKLGPHANKACDLAIRCEALENRMPATEAEISEAKADLEELKGKEGVTEEDIAEAEEAFEALKTRHEVDPAEIEGLEKQLEHLQANGGDPEQIKTLEDVIGDLKEPATQEKIDGLKAEVKSLEEKSGYKAEDVKLAREKVSATSMEIAQIDARLGELNQAYDHLKSETDQAPKSRELLFMELERIQRFRGMLIDMANSFMRDMARRVKEIMQ